MWNGAGMIPMDHPDPVEAVLGAQSLPMSSPITP
jgi:hypothetical protein